MKPLTPGDEPLDPAAASVLTKVRRLMAVSVAFTALAVAAVLGVIGYRVFKSEGSRPPPELSVKLPAGARVVSTAVAADRIVVTLDVAGQTELHLFDIQTLQPRGRLKLNAEP